MTDAAITERRSRISPIWAVPILSAALAIYVVVKSAIERGPLVEVTFSSAEGIEPGETKVRRLSVEIGVVEDVHLTGEGGDVVAELRIEPTSADLLRVGTRFWVVRPRIGASGVSGLSTLLSGGYIELDPGGGDTGAREFRGLDDPPPVSQDAQGTHVELVADRAESIGVGSPLLYHGFEVGQVEETKLRMSDGLVHYRAFVEAPYDSLLTAETRFWNASGVRFEAGTEGLVLQTQSIETMVAGGIAFGMPQGGDPGPRISSGHVFHLYEDLDSSREPVFEQHVEYLLMFDTSVRGLEAGAPVEYRGLRIGVVDEISLALVPEELSWSPEQHALIPVLIRLQPGRLGDDSAAGSEHLRGLLDEAATHGLRAQLTVSSLLTGALIVEFDYHPELPPEPVHRLEEFAVYPTTEAGLTLLKHRFRDFLVRIDRLPIEDLVGNAARALGAAADVGESANVLLADASTRRLPGELAESLTALKRVLGGFDPDSPAYGEIVGAARAARLAIEGLGPDSDAYRELVDALSAAQLTIRDASALLRVLEERPSALLFSSGRAADPTPRRPR